MTVQGAYRNEEKQLGWQGAGWYVENATMVVCVGDDPNNKPGADRCGPAFDSPVWLGSPPEGYVKCNTCTVHEGAMRMERALIRGRERAYIIDRNLRGLHAPRNLLPEALD